MIGSLFGDRQFEQLIACAQTAMDYEHSEPDRYNAAETGIHLFHSLKSWPRFYQTRKEFVEAALYFSRAETRTNMPHIGFDEAIEASIADYEYALDLLDKLPDVEDYWITSAANLALLYAKRISGDIRENLEMAIGICMAAKERQEVLGDLEGLVYSYMNLASFFLQADTLGMEGAIDQGLACLASALARVSENSQPAIWTKLKLAEATLLREVKGDRRDQALEAAIEIYNEVSLFLTPEAGFLDWVRARHNLALLWMDRTMGSKQENIDAGLAVLEDILEHNELTAFPVVYGDILLKKSSLLMKRICQNPREAHEAALACAEKSLMLFLGHSNKAQLAFDPEAIDDRHYSSNVSNVSGNAYAAKAQISQILLSMAEYRTVEDPERILRYASEAELEAEQNQDLDRLITALNVLQLYFYSKRMPGDPATNQENSIAYGMRLLEVSQFNESQLHTTCVNLGHVFMDRIKGNHSENVAKAINFYRKAVNFFEKGGYPVRLINARTSLATALIEQNKLSNPFDIEEAIALLQANLNIDAIQNDNEKLSSIALQMGIAYSQRMLGEREISETIILQSYRFVLETCGPSFRYDLWGSALLNLGHSYLDGIVQANHSIELALKCAEQVLEAKTDYPSSRILTGAKVLKMRALGSMTGDASSEAYTQAEKLAEQLLSAPISSEEKAYVHEYYSELLGKSDTRLEDAIASLKSALETYTFATTPFKHFKVSLRLGTVATRIGDWQLAHKAFSNAIECYQDQLSTDSDEHIVRKVLKDIGFSIDLIPMAAAIVGDISKALEFVELLKGRKIHKRSSAVREEEESSEISELIHLRNIVEKGLGGVTGSERIDVVKKLKGLQHLAAQSNASSFEASPAKSVNITNLLAENESWVFVPLLSDRKAIALLIPPYANINDVIASPLWDHGINDFLNVLSGPEKRGWAATLDMLRPVNEDDFDLWQENEARLRTYFRDSFGKWLIKKIEHANPTERHVSFILHGILNIVPWSLLSGSDSDSIIRNYSISFHPNFSNVVSSQSQAIAAQPLNPRVTIVAGEPERLNFSQLETELISICFAGNSDIVGHQDTLDVSGQELPYIDLPIFSETHKTLAMMFANSEYWHIASHGKANAVDVEKSSIEINSETSITLRELDILLRGKEARLAVLCACETGILDGMNLPAEFDGFVGSFLQLGVTGVLGTLWSVSDLTTPLLMSKFYEEHIENHNRPSKALTLAQNWLRDTTAQEFIDYLSKRVDNPQLSSDLLNRLTKVPPSLQPFASPFYWAGFVLYGA